VGVLAHRSPAVTKAVGEYAHPTSLPFVKGKIASLLLIRPEYRPTPRKYRVHGLEAPCHEESTSKRDVIDFNFRRHHDNSRLR
jgi:hypothetical protein